MWCECCVISEAVLLYKEVVSIHIDMGKFNMAAKIQKEIGELYEAEADNEKAIEAYQTSADYHLAEENNSHANQMLLKVAQLAAQAQDYKRAVEIYERVAITSLESNLLKFSAKDYLMRAGLCRLATGELGSVVNALERCAPTMPPKILQPCPGMPTMLQCPAMLQPCTGMPPTMLQHHMDIMDDSLGRAPT